MVVRDTDALGSGALASTNGGTVMTSVAAGGNGVVGESAGDKRTTVDADAAMLIDVDDEDVDVTTRVSA